ncbi:uncharacterized protein LOC124443862, partial [Xenia sp. Carnegie-2017]|uniref:uncharacterized protein LOC124443862 n=1 Tax=Xenia sp. Carnegie-2017 TaxID=2897299 RepID=UPI001F035555
LAKTPSRFTIHSQKQKKVKSTLDNTLTLDKAINTVRAAEISHAQVKNLATQPLEAAAIQTTRASYQKRSPQQKGKPCRRCGTHHLINQCPAYGQKCSKCQSKNHYAKMCFANSSRHKLHKITQETPQETQDGVKNYHEIFLGEINKPNGNEILTSIKVNNKVISFKIDTGAQCNIMPLSVFTSLNDKPTLYQTNTKIKAYGGTQVPIRGKYYMNIEHNNKKIHSEFYVVEIDNSKPLIGLQTAATSTSLAEMMSVKFTKPNKTFS